MHRRILRCAQRYGICFAPAKYELVHFTRARNRFNLAATIQLGQETECTSSPSVRGLGVCLDTKLNWKAHSKVIQEKGAIALTAPSRLIQMTWGPTLRRARVLYTACVRTALTYGAEAWHESGKRGAVVRKLERAQAACLRKIIGAYRAMPNRDMEPEAAIPPISMYCEGMWKYRGRTDDIIVLLNGVNINPLLMEGILMTHPKVVAALLTGTGKVKADWLIEVVHPPQNEEETTSLVEELWPTVEKANDATYRTEGKVSKDNIIFTSKDKPMLRAGKGSVQRKFTLVEFRLELDALYE
ncbi:hypothetical protein EAE96_010426 [Botrytis aclada]|nr:hypothetical protein EAE96_010426 [Botrytis aclada]